MAFIFLGLGRQTLWASLTCNKGVVSGVPLRGVLYNALARRGRGSGEGPLLTNFLLRDGGARVRYAQVEAEQSQQRELAQEKEEMTAAFANLNRLVEDDAEKEADFLKVNHT